MVVRLDRCAWTEDPLQQAVGRDLHRVLRELPDDLPVTVVLRRLREVLHEAPAPGDVEHLHSAADCEDGQVAREGRGEQGQLGAIALGLRVLGLDVRRGAVGGGVDVVSAREDQGVDGVEGLLDAVLGRRDQERPPARLMDRVHVHPADHGGLPLPDRPAGTLGVGGQSDEGDAHRTDSARWPTRPNGRSCMVAVVSRGRCRVGWRGGPHHADRSPNVARVSRPRSPRRTTVDFAPETSLSLTCWSEYRQLLEFS